MEEALSTKKISEKYPRSDLEGLQSGARANQLGTSPGQGYRCKREIEGQVGAIAYRLDHCRVMKVGRGRQHHRLAVFAIFWHFFFSVILGGRLMVL